MGQFERLVLSVLVDADRTDTADFMSNRQTEKIIDKNIWSLFNENMESMCQKFEKRTDSISILRNDISKRCADFANHNVGVCRLIVPTGGGKTYSSLRFAIKYCKEHHKERIFYIAPFMSILEQNSDVIRGIVGEEYLLEHHSDAFANINDEDELNKYEIQTDQWAMPVIATTMVQYLNTLFCGQMSSVRRMHRLCNSVIIIDEIQSLPVKCVSLFNLAINFITQIGGASVVLCSATQPALENTNYKLILDSNESMTGDYTEDFQAFSRNKILPELTKSGYTFEEAAAYCLDKFYKEGNVLFVVNTKKAVAEIYKILVREASKDIKIVHLSTNMCPEHRRDIIKSLKDILNKSTQPDSNKNPACPDKVICVTTQLIEAGVDISFPCVIRSLAGMDNIAQAAGRCNRNMEFGQCCNVYLLNLRDEHLGRLKEIKNAQDVSRQIVNNAGYPDLLAVRTMTDYFRKLYRSYEDNSKEMDYQSNDAGVATTVLSLLSVNQNRWNMKDHCRSESRINKQAFKTAGKNFQVIENNTRQVLVYYNAEAKKLISDLDSEQGIYDKMQILRKAQKYTIQLYEYMLQNLNSKNAVRETKAGVLVLREEYYDRDMGFIPDSNTMEFLNF